MRKIKKIITVILVMGMIIAVNANMETVLAGEITTDDITGTWNAAGTYQMPNDEIQREITFNDDGSYELQEFYIDNTSEDKTTKGTYSIEGNMVITRHHLSSDIIYYYSDGKLYNCYEEEIDSAMPYSTYVKQADVGDEEEIKKEKIEGISFREIPWGTTIREFLDNDTYSSWWNGDKRIPADGDYYTFVPSLYTYDYYLSSPYAVNEITYDKYSYASGRVLDWYMFYDNIQVAGYDIDDVSMFFMQPVNDDGSVDHEPNDAEFYMAIYTMNDVLDRISVFDDLTEKLTSLYGEMVYEQFSDQVIRSWKDESGNSVSLVRYDTEWESLDSIEIIYMAGTAMDDIQKLDAAMYDEELAVNEEQRQENIDNVSGL